ncbi:MAG: hypothetical protein P8X83_08385 [Nitrosopumilaceae archaeon]
MPTSQIVTKTEKFQDKEKISICDLTKNNTAEILQKIEYQIPIYLQGYTDLFTKYIHSFNSGFGACRMSEKQFFDKLGIDHTVMEEVANYWDFVKSLTIIQIETYSKFIQDYMDFKLSTIDSWGKSFSSALDHYQKAIADLGKKKFIA